MSAALLASREIESMPSLTAMTRIGMTDAYRVLLANLGSAVDLKLEHRIGSALGGRQWKWAAVFIATHLHPRHGEIIAIGSTPIDAARALIQQVRTAECEGTKLDRSTSQVEESEI